LHDEKRVKYMSATDDEALEAFQYCCKLEGIIPALEPAHALAVVKKIAPKMSSSQVVVMNMCGRGDKDIFTIAKALKIEI
jgi:tryptophan synthase beta chain